MVTTHTPRRPSVTRRNPSGGLEGSAMTLAIFGIVGLVAWEIYAQSKVFQGIGNVASGTGGAVSALGQGLGGALGNTGQGIGDTFSAAGSGAQGAEQGEGGIFSGLGGFLSSHVP